MTSQSKHSRSQNLNSLHRKFRRLGLTLIRRARLVTLALFSEEQKLKRGIREMRLFDSAPTPKPRNCLLQTDEDQELYDFTMQLLDDIKPSSTEAENSIENGVNLTDPEQLNTIVDRIARARLEAESSAKEERLENVLISREQIDFGSQLTQRASTSLRSARADSEEAVLRIGSEISEFYKIAKQANEAINSSLQIAVDSGDDSTKDGGSGQLCVTEMIRKQQENMSSFLSQVIAYFDRQTELAGQSKSSFSDVQNCVKQVERIVRSAQVLAVNVQVESARLGEKGRAFSILGSKMKTFSEQVEQANESIQTAVGDVVGVMSDFESEALEIDSQLHGYVTQFSNDLAQVDSRAKELKTSMVDTLEMVNSSNKALIERSQNALSALQFQDPLVKNLLQIEDDLRQLNDIVQTGQCEAAEAAPEEADELAAVGPVSGEVELF